MNKERSVAFGQRDHVIGQDRVAAPSQRRCRRRFSRALGSHKGHGFFTERHRAGVQTRHAPQSQQYPENWTQEICSRVFDRQILGPSRPDFATFPIQPELCSVEVGEPQIPRARGLPNSESRVACVILVRTRIAQLFRPPGNYTAGLRRSIEVDRYSTDRSMPQATKYHDYDVPERAQECED